MKNSKTHVTKLVFLAMMVALGVVISPILRVEGMCPMAHFINVTCAVMLGPWYAFVCALAIGIIRMVCMGIPPLALTGAVFGAFLSGMLYRLSKGKLVCAFIGEVIGTGIIGAIVSYPVMTLIWGRTGLTWFFYVPSFIAGTLIGGSLAFIFLKHLQKAHMLSTFQTALGSQVYTNTDTVVNDSLGIAFLGFIGYLASTVAVKQFVAEPGPVAGSIKYIVLLAFVAMAVVYEKGWFCENRECRFVLWKDNAFFKRLGKHLDAHVADKLLRDGRVRLKDCKSAKGKTYNATVLLGTEADGRSKFSLEFEGGC